MRFTTETRVCWNANFHPGLNEGVGVRTDVTLHTFIYFRSSLENHNRIQTKSGKSLYPFSNQNGAKTIPFGAAHTPSRGSMIYVRL